MQPCWSRSAGRTIRRNARRADGEVFYAARNGRACAAVDAAAAAHSLDGAARKTRERDAEPSVFRGALARAASARARHPARARALRRRGRAHGVVAAPLSGIRYSFTGHANDIFCATDFPVGNAQLVADAEFVVTETDFARRWMEEKYPRAAGKVRRIFNGIALDGFPARSDAGGAADDSFDRPRCRKKRLRAT